MPTSSLDSLRCALALASLWDLWLITSDVSTAFMYAEVEEDACDLVLLPSNISFQGERVVCLFVQSHEWTEKGATTLVFLNYNVLFMLLEVKTLLRAHFSEFPQNKDSFLFWFM